MNQELILPFGVDPSVEIEYKTVKIQKEVKESQGKELTTYTHHTTIQNNKSIPILLKFMDQVPECTTESIKVKLIEPTRTKENQMNINGNSIAEWFVTIAPNSSAEVPFSYSVESLQGTKIAKNFSW